MNLRRAATAGAARIGDVFLAAAPGEMFPQAQFGFRGPDGVAAQAHFFLGAANDFLGYMAPTDSFPQVTSEGTTYLGGCPEDHVHRSLGTPHDDACTDHFILMATPVRGGLQRPAGRLRGVDAPVESPGLPAPIAADAA